MSRGKYSPTITREIANRPDSSYCYNADRQLPPKDWTAAEYSIRIHFDNYDSEGFDRYGYSAFDEDGNYVGIGDGVDRAGYTELEYLEMSAEEFESLAY